MNVTEQLAQAIEIPEKGFEFLKLKVQKLNQKAQSQNLPCYDIITLSENTLPVKKLDMWGKEELVGYKKTFVVRFDVQDSPLNDELLKYYEACQGEEWEEEPIDPKRIDVDAMLKYMVLTYIVRGKFVPKNKADSENPPTTEEATKVLFDVSNKTEIHNKAKFSGQIRSESGILTSRISHWMKKTDFTEFGKTAPEWTSYFDNLNKVARSKTIDISSVNYMGGILQTFLRIEKEKQKEELNKGEGYVGIVGQPITFYGTPLHMKKFKNGIGFRYFFRDLNGNIIKLVTKTNMGFEKGKTYVLSGEVKSHEVDTWCEQPTTVIINAKAEPTKTN